jgi:hypothetical protein
MKEVKENMCKFTNVLAKNLAIMDAFWVSEVLETEFG